jgi:hypothetical protein
MLGFLKSGNWNKNNLNPLSRTENPQLFGNNPAFTGKSHFSMGRSKKRFVDLVEVKAQVREMVSQILDWPDVVSVQLSSFEKLATHCSNTDIDDLEMLFEQEVVPTLITAIESIFLTSAETQEKSPFSEDDKEKILAFIIQILWKFTQDEELAQQMIENYSIETTFVSLMQSNYLLSDHLHLGILGILIDITAASTSVEELLPIWNCGLIPVLISNFDHSNENCVLASLDLLRNMTTEDIRELICEYDGLIPKFLSMLQTSPLSSVQEKVLEIFENLMNPVSTEMIDQLNDSYDFLRVIAKYFMETPHTTAREISASVLSSACEDLGRANLLYEVNMFPFVLSLLIDSNNINSDFFSSLLGLTQAMSFVETHRTEMYSSLSFLEQLELSFSSYNEFVKERGLSNIGNLVCDHRLNAIDFCQNQSKILKKVLQTIKGRHVSISVKGAAVIVLYNLSEFEENLEILFQNDLIRSLFAFYKKVYKEEEMRSEEEFIVANDMQEHSLTIIRNLLNFAKAKEYKHKELEMSILKSLEAMTDREGSYQSIVLKLRNELLSLLRQRHSLPSSKSESLMNEREDLGDKDEIDSRQSKKRRRK